MPNVDSIYSLQIPKGLSLKDMEGYCPGSNGQVKLHYWTNDNSSNINSTEWFDVDQNKDFTYQWKLNNLQAGALYKLKIFSRQKNTQKITDSIFGSFNYLRINPQQMALNFVLFRVMILIEEMIKKMDIKFIQVWIK